MQRLQERGSAMITTALRQQPSSRRHAALFRETRWEMRAMVASAAMLLTSLAAMPASAAGAHPVDGKALLGAADNRSEWLTQSWTYDEQRSTPLDHLNSSPVKTLSMAWSAA